MLSKPGKTASVSLYRVAVAIMLLSVLGLVGPARAGQDCSISENQLLGNWQRSSDTGFFETMNLSVEDGEHVFNSWLHSRPEVFDAPWSLSHCQLVIGQYDDELGSFQFAVSLHDRRLILTDPDSGKTARYDRIGN